MLFSVKEGASPFAVRSAVSRAGRALAVMTGLACAVGAHAQTLCVFDPLGTQGDNYSLMRDYVVVAKGWGADIQLKPFTDEKQALDQLTSGKCDAASITGLRARAVNNFAGSTDSIGSMMDVPSMRTAMTVLANPKLAPDMVSDGYEVAGVLPIGQAYIIVNDRQLNSLAHFLGKRFGSLDYDKAQAEIVTKVGGKSVPVELSNTVSKFSSNQVDAIILPAMAIKPFEVPKAIDYGNKGAIIRFPLAYVTMEVVTHQNKFPDGFGQKSREWMLTQLPRAISVISRIEHSLDPKLWMDLPEADKQGYLKLMREARITLTRQGVYNKKLMGILKKVRCQQQPTNFECQLTDE